MLTRLFIQNTRSATHQRFDIAGFALSGASLSCLLFGFATGSRGAGEASATIALIGAGLASGAAYVAYALRQRRITPILDLSLMRIPTFRVSVVGGSFCRITQGAQPFLLPLMMQVGFGMSAAESGLLTFATGCGAVLMKAIAAPILRSFGFRSTLIWNSVVSSLPYAACAAFRPGWPHWVMFALPAICGFSMSLQFTAYNTVAYDDIPSERAAAANGFYSTFQQLMLSFGICTGTLALTASWTIGDRLHPTIGDFSTALLAVTAISLIAAPVCLGFPINAGAATSGQRRKTDNIEINAIEINAAT